MRHEKVDHPKYWRQWLQQRGVTEAVARHVAVVYRALRFAHERMWTFAYAGGVGGALIAALAAPLLQRLTANVAHRGLRVGFMLLGSALAASLVWWALYSLMHRSRLRARASLLTGHELQGEEPYVDRIIEAVAAELARSPHRPRDEQLEIDQLTQATIVTGLREAPASELERNLLERLVGSAIVPAADGGVFVFRLGAACARCAARTRSGPLRLLNVPAHWALENGFQRLSELPTRGKHLLVVPGRTQDLTEYLGGAATAAGRPVFFGPKAEVYLCEACARKALGLEVLQERNRPPRPLPAAR